MRRLRRPRGYVLAVLVIVLAAISTMLVASANWASSRFDLARRAYLDASALALAQGGVEAAAATLGRGGPAPATHPLGGPVELTGATAELEVNVSRAGNLARVTACADVRPGRRREAPVQRCVDANIELSPNVRIVGWTER